MIHMASAVGAGAVADIICNPMFVVRTRLQTEAIHSQHMQQQHASPRRDGGIVAPRNHHSTIQQTIQLLYTEGGIRIFWRGMSANLLGLSHVAVQFPVYEVVKERLQQRQAATTATDRTADLSASPILIVVASIVSKLTASLLTYPHEVIRSRLMDARPSSSSVGATTPAASVTLIGTCRRIYRQHGLSGFYVGLPISLIRVLPNTVVTFCVYEFTLRALLTRTTKAASTPTTDNGNNGAKRRHHNSDNGPPPPPHRSSPQQTQYLEEE
jgi:solute carrier family 25 (mitochondrial folate transporter), member 32